MLLKRVSELLKPKMRSIVVKLGYNEGARFAELKRVSEDMSVEYTESGMIIRASVPVDAEI